MNLYISERNNLENNGFQIGIGVALHELSEDFAKAFAQIPQCTEQAEARYLTVKRPLIIDKFVSCLAERQALLGYKVLFHPQTNKLRCKYD